LQAFARYAWPGNLRQLLQALRTACALLASDETCITWTHLPDELLNDLSAQEPHSVTSAVPAGRPTAPQARCGEAPMPDTLDALSRAAIHRALDSCAGNVSQAARRLGISRQTLYRKLKD
jgi:transcriptional regulator of acetoin/glycerol metabolism